jgi:hypothetical protein
MSTLSKPCLRPAVSQFGREEEDEAALLLWVCPHKCVTLDQARAMFLYRPPDAKNGYMERLRACYDAYCSYDIINSLLHSFHDQHTLTLRTNIILLRIQGCGDYDEAAKRCFTVQRVSLALSRLKFPMCRHMRTNASHAIDYFNPSCIYLPKGDGTDVPCTCRVHGYPFSHAGDHHFRACLECRGEGCETVFGFRACATTQDGRRDLLLQLELWRSLGCIENSHAPGWRCHAYGEGMTHQIAQDWQLWIDSIGLQEVKLGGLSRSLRLDRIASFLVDKLGTFKPTLGLTLPISPRGHSQQPGNERVQGSGTPRRNKPNTHREIPRRKCVLMSCQYGSQEIHPSARGGFRC